MTVVGEPLRVNVPPVIVALVVRDVWQMTALNDPFKVPDAIPVKALASPAPPHPPP